MSETRILIVDDEQGIRRTMSAILREKGYGVETAASGREALEKANTSSFNIALIDIHLPDLEGTALISLLKRHLPDLAIIIITGDHSSKMAILALNSGAVGYILKPMNMDEVLDKIRSTVENQFLVQENRRLLEEVRRELAERKKAEIILGEQMEILRAVLDNIPVMLAFVNTAGEITTVNDEFRKRIGWFPELHPRELLPKMYPDPDYMQQVMDFIMSTQTGWCDFRVQTQRNGTLECSWAIVRLSDGTLIVIGIDITERKISANTMQTLLRRLVDAHEKERRRVARELHDSVNQILSSANIRIQLTRNNICDHDAEAHEQIQKGLALLKDAMKEVRRISHNLRPSVLDDLGLLPAIRSLCTDFRSRSEINVDCVCSGLPERLPPEVDLTLYRIIQEAMSNIEKHSAASDVSLRLLEEEGYLCLTIKDNGRGFDPLDLALKRKKDTDSGLGLIHIPERAASVKGAADITSSPGEGTTVSVRIPLPNDHKEKLDYGRQEA